MNATSDNAPPGPALTPEAEHDLDEVEALYDLAFGPGRTGLSSYRLRIGAPPIAALCLVLRDEYQTVIGAVRSWPIRLGDPAPGAPALLLGPIAVHPTRQSEGLGAQLILESLERARDLGWRAVMLVGDEPYYRRFGFRRALAEPIAFPEPTNPKRVLALELRPGALAGVAGPARRWAERGGETEPGSEAEP